MLAADEMSDFRNHGFSSPDLVVAAGLNEAASRFNAYKRQTIVRKYALAMPHGGLSRDLRGSIVLFGAFPKGSMLLGSIARSGFKAKKNQCG
jgi:hypothetical protein